MSDKKLLELAAKAAGIEIAWMTGIGSMDFETGKNWNPLKDDAQALRLAVKLRMDIGFGTHDLYGEAVCYANNCWETLDDDPYAATRRAIVRAAAEIGRSHD